MGWVAVITWSLSLSTPSCLSTVSAFRAMVATEPWPKACGAPFRMSAFTAEQTRFSDSTLSSGDGSGPAPQRRPLVGSETLVLSLLTVAEELVAWARSWPAALATACRVEAPLTLATPKVASLPSTLRCSAWAAAVPWKLSGVPADAGPAESAPVMATSSAKSPPRYRCRMAPFPPEWCDCGVERYLYHALW